MRLFAITAVLAALFLSTAQVTSPVPQANACAPLGKQQLRTTLYFGLTYNTGTNTGIVSESQWRSFLRNEVSARFPQGLTVWEADGQWRQPDGRVARERSKVLLLVHNDTPETRASLAALVTSYKNSFKQESVLWETAPVCAAF
jgi:hypothetical protein